MSAEGAGVGIAINHAAEVEHEVGAFHDLANLGLRAAPIVGAEVKWMRFRQHALAHGRHGEGNTGRGQKRFQLPFQSVARDRVGRNNDGRFCFREPGQNCGQGAVQFCVDARKRRGLGKGDPTDRSADDRHPGVVFSDLDVSRHSLGQSLENHPLHLGDGVLRREAGGCADRHLVVGPELIEVSIAVGVVHMPARARQSGARSADDVEDRHPLRLASHDAGERGGRSNVECRAQDRGARIRP